jgi:hypothetical protein
MSSVNTNVKSVQGGEIMTQAEFNAFRRSLASPAVHFKLGKISADDLYKSLLITIGEDIFEETEKLIKKLDDKN